MTCDDIYCVNLFIPWGACVTLLKLKFKRATPYKCVWQSHNGSLRITIHFEQTTNGAQTWNTCNSVRTRLSGLYSTTLPDVALDASIHPILFFNIWRLCVIEVQYLGYFHFCSWTVFHLRPSVTYGSSVCLASWKLRTDSLCKWHSSICTVVYHFCFCIFITIDALLKNDTWMLCCS